MMNLRSSEIKWFIPFVMEVRRKEKLKLLLLWKNYEMILLVYDPTKRFSAEEALRHPYFDPIDEEHPNV